MTTRLAGSMLTLALLVTVPPAAQTNEARVALEQAKKIETIDGDLRGAIEAYQAIVDNHRRMDRSVAAVALLRIAECYQNLGDVRARDAYERIIREFADQSSVVAMARTRLGRSARPNVARGDRPVWTGRDVDLFGTVSPDGRYLSYVDWETTGNLMLRDLSSNVSRALTANTPDSRPGGAGYSVMSRDGRQIAFEWWNRAPAVIRNEVKIAPLTAAGIPRSISIWSTENDDTARPLDWSPDGRQLLVIIGREDRTSQLALLGIDGSLRVLKSVGWRGISGAGFSPDGRFIAYDLAAADGTAHRAIAIMAADATRETRVTEDRSSSRFMGWSRDGRSLLFASDRTGELALWALTVKEGKAEGPAVVVRSQLASSSSLGLSSDDTLFIWKRAGAPYVAVVPFDTKGSTGPSKPVFQAFIESRGRPAWSADGTHLLFVSCGPAGGGPCTIRLWSVATGVTRQVGHSLVYVQFPRPSPDGRLIVTNGTDAKGRRGLYMINSETGATELVEPIESRVPVAVGWSRDGKRLYLSVLQDEGRLLLERDLSSGETRKILNLPQCANPAISPDGKSIACRLPDTSTKPGALWIAPLNGGSPVAHQIEVPNARRWIWSSGSDGVIVTSGLSWNEPRELWFVPFAGTPRRVAIDTTNWLEGGHFGVSPDGRLMSFVSTAGTPGAEVWALENLLSDPTSRK
jgi:Tol biopolymer transport system component